MTIGERIQNARKKSGLTQEELGERVGVTGVAIMRYEKGARQPRLEQLRQIALALGTSVSELVEPGYWGSLSQEERDGMWGTGHATIAAPQQRINTQDARERVEATMEQLSPEGQVKVADYAEDILPRYQAQTPASASPPAPEGRDTTPPQEGSEGPQEGGER